MISRATHLDDSSIDRIALGVIDCSHPYTEWDHQAHFAWAVWMLRHPEISASQGDIETILRRYNKAVGIPDIPTRGYHATITIASVCAASAFLRGRPQAPLSIVLGALMSGEPGSPAWLTSYWTEDRLMSLEARRA
jgi:hypothetical protein